MGLNEVFASAMQGVAAKGTELLAQPVEVAFKGLNQGGWDLVAGLKDVSLGVPVSFSRDMVGGGVLFLPKGQAALMGELMMGNEPPEIPSALSEMNSTAAAEVLSQMIGALGEGLGRVTRRQVAATSGEPKEMGADALVSAGKSLVREDRIAMADCSIKIGKHTAGRLVLVIPASMADSLGSEKAAQAASAAPPDLILGAPQSGAGGVTVQRAQFGAFQVPSAGAASPEGNLDLLMDVPLDITVELGRASRRVRDVLSLSPGSIVELSKLAGEPVDLLVNGRPIAKGEVVVIDENFAVRIVEILSREDRLSGGL